MTRPRDIEVYSDLPRINGPLVGWERELLLPLLERALVDAMAVDDDDGEGHDGESDEEAS